MHNEKRMRPFAAVVGVLALLLVLTVATRTAKKPSPRPKPGPTADKGASAKDPAGTRRQYRTEPVITLYNAKTGKVERIRMEDYVAGVVAAEMDTSWPKEALAAQSILARTFTLQKMEQGKTKHGTDASTDVKEFQAYAAEKANNRVRDAVRSTRGKVITYKGRYVRAYFHSCSGGLTSPAAEGLDFHEEPTPYLKVVRDPPCDDPAQQHWTATFTADEVLKAASQAGAKASSLSSIRVGRRGPSGRAIDLAIDGTAVSAPAFRTAIGPDRMKSTLLESLRLEGDRVVMSGRGWGHGVGMSQFGALDKARKGWDAERIINYYFQGVKIERLWR